MPARSQREGARPLRPHHQEPHQGECHVAFRIDEPRKRDRKARGQEHQQHYPEPHQLTQRTDQPANPCQQDHELDHRPRVVRRGRGREPPDHVELLEAERPEAPILWPDRRRNGLSYERVRGEERVIVVREVLLPEHEGDEGQHERAEGDLQEAGPRRSFERGVTVLDSPRERERYRSTGGPQDGRDQAQCPEPENKDLHGLTTVTHIQPSPTGTANDRQPGADHGWRARSDACRRSVTAPNSSATRRWCNSCMPAPVAAASHRAVRTPRQPAWRSSRSWPAWSAIRTDRRRDRVHLKHPPPRSSGAGSASRTATPTSDTFGYGRPNRWPPRWWRSCCSSPRPSLPSRP